MQVGALGRPVEQHDAGKILNRTDACMEGEGIIKGKEEQMQDLWDFIPDAWDGCRLLPRPP